MKSDSVTKIWIDDIGQLCLAPETAIFQFIYREAVEVYWNQDQKYLYGPKPREWNYTDWYLQIHTAAIQQGIYLKITSNTFWLNIEDKLKQDILDALETEA